MSDHIVATEDELSDSGRLITQIQGREIAIFNVNGEYFAYTNWCAHQAGPACEGPIAGTQEAVFDRGRLEISMTWNTEQKFVSCPWHGWEFDVTTGECLSNDQYALPSHPVRVEDGEVIVTL